MCVETDKMFLECVFMNAEFEFVKRKNKMLILFGIGIGGRSEPDGESADHLQLGDKTRL